MPSVPSLPSLHRRRNVLMTVLFRPAHKHHQTFASPIFLRIAKLSKGLHCMIHFALSIIYALSTAGIGYPGQMSSATSSLTSTSSFILVLVLVLIVLLVLSVTLTICCAAKSSKVKAHIQACWRRARRLLQRNNRRQPAIPDPGENSAAQKPETGGFAPTQDSAALC